MTDKSDDIDIVIKAPFTITERLQEVQRLDWQDPKINEKMAVALRKIADDLDARKIGFYSLATAVEHSFDHLPKLKVSFELADIENRDKHRRAK